MILITGADGFLASRLAKAYEGKYKLAALNRKQMDFTKEEEIKRNFDSYRPEIVIHCGAISDIGSCEKDPKHSYDVNVTGTKLLACASERIGAKFLFCSSDQVYFSDEDAVSMEPHKETEKVHPPHHYGRQKLEAEEICMEESSDCICMRLSWMYDWESLSVRDHSDLVRQLQEAAANTTLTFAANDYRSITNVREAAARMETLFTAPSGIYNFGSPSDISTYEAACEALACLGRTDITLLPEDKPFAQGNRNLMMDMTKAKNAGILFHTTKEGLRESFRKNNHR